MLTVLLVGDESHLLRLRSALQQMSPDATVVEAVDGLHAMELGRTGLMPDAIIVCLAIPPDAMQWISQLRPHKNSKPVPLIFLSADPPTWKLENCLFKATPADFAGYCDAVRDALEMTAIK